MPVIHDTLFKTLADPTRRAIFERLCRDGEQTVGALTSLVGAGIRGASSATESAGDYVQGVGGLMSITGLPGQGPMRVGIPIADLGAGTSESVIRNERALARPGLDGDVEALLNEGLDGVGRRRNAALARECFG